MQVPLTATNNVLVWERGAAWYSLEGTEPHHHATTLLGMTQAEYNHHHATTLPGMMVILQAEYNHHHATTLPGMTMILQAEYNHHHSVVVDYHGWS